MIKPLRLLPLGLILFLLGGCGQDMGTPQTNPDYDYQATTALAKATLNALQSQSFRNNREYCGYIGLDENGRLTATGAATGRMSRCRPNPPPRDWVLIASYHTHGAYEEYVASEIPSTNDLNADFQEGTNGYISTPGGRLWFVDGRARKATLVCGPRCLKQDPLFFPNQRVRTSYTLEELEQL